MIDEKEISSWALSFYLNKETPQGLEEWKVFFLEEDYIQIMIRLVVLWSNYEEIKFTLEIVD